MEFFSLFAAISSGLISGTFALSIKTLLKIIDKLRNKSVNSNKLYDLAKDASNKHDLSSAVVLSIAAAEAGIKSKYHIDKQQTSLPEILQNSQEIPEDLKIDLINSYELRNKIVHQNEKIEKSKVDEILTNVSKLLNFMNI